MENTNMMRLRYSIRLTKSEVTIELFKVETLRWDNIEQKHTTNLKTLSEAGELVKATTVGRLAIQ